MPNGNNWELVLEGVKGNAQVFVNGQEVAKKDNPASGTVKAPVKAPAGSKVTVSVQMKSSEAKAGLTGTAKLVQKK